MIHIIPDGEEDYHFLTDCPCNPVISIDEETGEEICTHIHQEVGDVFVNSHYGNLERNKRL